MLNFSNENILKDIKISISILDKTGTFIKIDNMLLFIIGKEGINNISENEQLYKIFISESKEGTITDNKHIKIK